MKMTDMAVIMSVYYKDKLECLQESVQSILNQTFRDYHYYIAIDGPVQPDIDEYLTSLKDERIRLHRIEKNGGLAAALNYLLDILLLNSEYKYIARMDADDISLPARLENQRNFLIINPEVSVVGSWYEEIDDEGNHLINKILPTKHEELRKRYYTKTPFPHSSVMYDRRLFEIAGYYPTDTKLMEDNVLWGRALKKNLTFANLKQYLIKIRIDKSYFKRRSGVRYGWNYMLTRYNLKLSGVPGSYYLMILIIGIVKMMPACIVKLVKKIDNYFF
jgi:glycosyltransferase involved in cell wall biosynthesis